MRMCERIELNLTSVIPNALVPMSHDKSPYVVCLNCALGQEMTKILKFQSWVYNESSSAFKRLIECF